MFFDRVKYTATQVSSVLFNVSVVAGFNELPTTATRAKLYLIDTAGNTAVIDGYRSGTQIHVNFIHESSAALNVMPTFGVGLEIYSTVGADVLNNMLGSGLILQIGQSNGVGWAENSTGLLDWTDGRILQIDGSGNTILAVDSLEHPDTNPTRPANSTGMAMTLAKDLLRNEPHNQITIIPHCEGSTGFWEGQWVKGGYLYDGALAKVNAFLAANPNNYIIAIVWNLGEDDATDASRANAFQASFDLATTNLRADIVGNARQPDASRVPVICTQMSPGWNINASIPIVRTALAELPNRLPYTGHVDSAGATYLTSDFNIHFDGPGLRTMGSRIYPQIVAARGNVTPAGAGITGTANITLDEAISTATGSVVGSGADITGTVSTTLADAVSTASGTANTVITGSSATTLENATSTATGSIPEAIAVEFRRGVGQTTGATVTWANQGALGSSHDAVQSTAANQPTFDGSGNVVFDGTDDYLTLPGDVMSNANGYSVMIRFKKSSANFQALLGTDAPVDAVSRLYFITAPLTATSNDSPILNSSTSPSADTWHKAYLTVDSSNEQTLWLDGVQVGNTTGGTKGTGYTTTHIGVLDTVIYPLNGSISDLIIHPNALSLSEMNTATAGW